VPDDTDRNVDAVRAFFELMRERDIDAWGELWAADGHIVVPYPPEGFPTRIEGRADIVAGFRRLFGNFETFDYAIRTLHRTPDPDMILVEWHVSARVASTGYRYEGDPITVFVFRDGRIAEYRDYFDPQKFGPVVAALPPE
jgi:uncharacterized protein